ncbi:hypothetical protein CYMTET_34879, partial [Cymbomonas tetramitiformis]
PGMGLRLTDVAFGRLGMTVCDAAAPVRAEAVSRMAALPGVSLGPQLQSLTKKVTAMTTAGHSLDDPTAAKTVGFGDMDAQQAGSSTLESNMGQGAIVHGLEDEFDSVRIAAVDALCEMGLRHAAVAERAVDFLADMMNDELEAVRLDAVSSLTKLAQHCRDLTMPSDLLEVSLQGLADANPRVRHGVYALLEAVRLQNIAGLELTLEKLVASLRLQPQDEPAIARALCHLGAHHARRAPTVRRMAEWMVEPLVGQGRGGGFLCPEQSLGDTAYRAGLLLLLSAAAVRPTLPALLPKYALHHADILHEQFPDVLPDMSFIIHAPHVVLQTPGRRHDAAALSADTSTKSSLSSDASEDSITGLAEAVRGAAAALPLNRVEGADPAASSQTHIPRVPWRTRRAWAERQLERCEEAARRRAAEAGPEAGAAQLWAERAAMALLVGRSQEAVLRHSTARSAAEPGGGFLGAAGRLLVPT